MTSAFVTLPKPFCLWWDSIPISLFFIESLALRNVLLTIPFRAAPFQLWLCGIIVFPAPPPFFVDPAPVRVFLLSSLSAGPPCNPRTETIWDPPPNSLPQVVPFLWTPHGFRMATAPSLSCFGDLFSSHISSCDLPLRHSFFFSRIPSHLGIIAPGFWHKVFFFFFFF